MRPRDAEILGDVIKAGEDWLIQLGRTMKGDRHVPEEIRDACRDRLIKAVDELIAESELRK